MPQIEMDAPVGTPSPEELTLLQLRDGDYDRAAATMLDELSAGESPRTLAVAKPEILFPTAEVLWQTVGTAPHTEGEGYKPELFAVYLQAAIDGDPAAISALPKLATTPGELATAISLTLDNKDAVTGWRTGRKYVQFIGSFNPMHIGHRAAIGATLEAAGENASGLVQVVAAHPIKKDSLPPYRERFDPGEEKLYSSDQLDPTEVTMMDVPLSLGLAKVGYKQIELLADVTGDSEMRWQMGSDKFMTDVRKVKAGEQLDKAGARFSNVHLYVARRDTEDVTNIAEGVAYAQERFGANITIVPETSDVLILGAAASKIRALRAAGDHQAADEMEFSDLPRLDRDRYNQRYGTSQG